MQLTDLSAKDAATILKDTIETALLRLPRMERLSRMAAIGRALERYRREIGLTDEHNEETIHDTTVCSRTPRRANLRTRHAIARREASP